MNNISYSNFEIADIEAVMRNRLVHGVWHDGDFEWDEPAPRNLVHSDPVADTLRDMTELELDRAMDLDELFGLFLASDDAKEENRERFLDALSRIFEEMRRAARDWTRLVSDNGWTVGFEYTPHDDYLGEKNLGRAA